MIRRFSIMPTGLDEHGLTIEGDSGTSSRSHHVLGLTRLQVLLFLDLHVRLVERFLDGIAQPGWIETRLVGGLDLDDNLFAVGPIRQIRDGGKSAEDLVPFGFESVSDLRGLERRRGSGPRARAGSYKGRPPGR